MRLLLLALLLALRPARTQHLCARLPSNASCVRFSSLTALLPDAFACAPPGVDLLSVASPPATLKPAHQRACADWDGRHSDACAHATPPLLWEAVLIAVPADAVPAWFDGPVQRATLLLLSSTGAPTAHARVRRAPMPEAGANATLPALLLAHAPPGALFALLLRDSATALHPPRLLHLLRTAEAAVGTRQAYRLAGSLAAASALQAFSLPALRSLAAGRDDFPTLHCGHIVSNGSAYSRGAGQGSQAEPAPLPGNPVAVGGGGAPGADDALCSLPATAGDPWCAALQPPHRQPHVQTLDLVISHHSEPEASVRLTIEAVRAVRPEARVWLYSKGEPAAAAEVAHALGPLVHRLVLLPNVGREGHTYLSHITAHYHNLADATIFSQADGGGTRENASTREELSRRLPLLTNRTGVLNLGGAERSGCEGSPAFPFSRLRELYALTQHRLCPYVRQETYVSFMNGFFAVSAARVRSQPLQLYVYLLNLLDAPVAHFSHADAVDAFAGGEEFKIKEFTYLDGDNNGNWNAASYAS